MPVTIREHEARRIAVEAKVDPRSVRRVVRGESVRPLTAERVIAALRALGLDHLIPEAATAPRGAAR